jgi:sec-independent protein translocase protein TatA
LEVGLPELLLVLLVVALLFGAERIAEVGGALGRAFREFRQALHEQGERDPPPQQRYEAGDERPAFRH